MRIKKLIGALRAVSRGFCATKLCRLHKYVYVKYTKHNIY